MIAFALIVSSLSSSTMGQTELSATQILARCQAAYDSVNTFEETVQGQTGKINAIANIVYKRPGKLRATGHSDFGFGKTKYDLICTGGKTWVFNAGAWSEEKNPEMGIATLTGISASTVSTIPAALMHTNWAGLKPAPGTSIKVDLESRGGRNLYRLTFTKPFPKKLWIDASSFFLVRSETSVMQTTIRLDYGPVRLNLAIPDSAFVRN